MGITRICGTAALALAALVSASTFARERDGGMIELYPALSEHKPIWLEIKF